MKHNGLEIESGNFNGKNFKPTYCEDSVQANVMIAYVYQPRKSF